MTLEQITSLLKAFDESSASRLKYTCGEEQITLEKAVAQSAVVCAPVVEAAPVAAAQPAAAPAAAAPAAGATIDAPLVGTFYVASAPGEAPFVKPGDTVHKGQIIGLIEAMKMINEIPAPCDCVIESLVAQDGALVGFGDPLFQIREL
ncbi:acetyl-CoA carboxylase biotin carboxyl carrier protein [Allofournierella massiliensis]|uniref:Biotin carboxyl carrier protein of acetyl-CoA carboxylase n=1 Tax=Allofournierella massiliensis TaxID=1650663 RepID=A0ABT7US40_9FIRM|nr:acetyl-CoA carboxylase biotin carboxyl carrier protein [Fournierella massiliensis]MDM8201697.1 acetyl-CoA carboxylase biotin carboxyl carrier protein [Fournierella massiliensis]